MPNPKWYDEFTIQYPQYSVRYPNWQSLPSLTNSQIRDLWWKIGIKYPQGDIPSNDSLETFNPRKYYRPTPPGGWKLIPHQALMKVDHDDGFARLNGYLFQTGNIGPCITHSWMYCFLVRYWLAQSTIFMMGARNLIWSPNHSINLLLTVNEDGSINYVYRDFLQNKYATAFTKLSDILKPDGWIITIYMP